MHAIVHAANIQDRDGGAALMATLFGAFPFLTRLFANGGYRGPQFQAAIGRISGARDGRDRQAVGSGQGLRRPARALDRRTHLRLARPLPTGWPRTGECLNRKALAFLRLASIRLMLRKLCNPT